MKVLSIIFILGIRVVLWVGIVVGLMSMVIGMMVFMILVRIVGANVNKKIYTPILIFPKILKNTWGTKKDIYARLINWSKNDHSQATHVHVIDDNKNVFPQNLSSKSISFIKILIRVQTIFLHAKSCVNTLIIFSSDTSNLTYKKTLDLEKINKKCPLSPT